MENKIYDKTNGLWYEKQGDYYYPCLSLPCKNQVAIGKWGLICLDDIKKHHQIFYLDMMYNGKLNAYLASVDRRSKDMHRTLLEQYKAEYGITEELKAKDQLEWVRQMNSISHMADEAVMKEIVWSEN